jgi:hypothetical protein
VGFLLIPIIVLGSLVVFFGLLVVLGRVQNGRFLRPVVMALMKIGFMRKLFEKASKAAMERQNPELASAMKKLQRLGPNPDPQRAQQALLSLSPPERRAYLEMIEAQGGMPEPANRQHRRQQQKFQGAVRSTRSGGKRSKRRR